MSSGVFGLLQRLASPLPDQPRAEHLQFLTNLLSETRN